MSLDCCVALPHDATGLSAVCDCGISRPCSLTFFIYKEVNPASDISSHSILGENDNKLTDKD